MTRKRLSTPSRVLRRKNRVATQLCRRLPIRHAHPHTCDMRRDDNGCGDPSPPTGPLPFRSALRSPFTSSARTAVSLSAVPFAVPQRRYSSPSQVYGKYFTISCSFCQGIGMFFQCFRMGFRFTRRRAGRRNRPSCPPGSWRGGWCRPRRRSAPGAPYPKTGG